MSAAFKPGSQEDRIWKYVYRSELPTDVRNFTLGNIQQDSCIFCRQYNSYDANLITLSGIDPEDFDGSDIVRNFEVGTCVQCNNLYYNALAANHPDVQQRVYYLATHGVIPEYAEKEGFFDDGDMRGHCVLCKHPVSLKELDEQGEWPYGTGYIVPPFDNKWKKVNCFLSVCKFCYDQLNFRLKGEDLFSEYSVDSCWQCESEYAVTAEELAYRKGMGSLGEHLCPECLNSNGMAGIQRFENAACAHKGCENAVALDVTHSNFIDNYDSKFYCEVHSENGAHIAIIDGFKIVAHSRDKLYYFKIIYMDNHDPRKDSQVYDSETYNEYFNTEYNAIFNGCCQVLDVIEAMDENRPTPNVRVNEILEAIELKTGGEE